MPLNRFLLLFSYSLQTFLTNTISVLLINTTENYLNNHSVDFLNKSQHILNFSDISENCNSANDCNIRIANSWCNIRDHKCYCDKGYQQTSDGSCLLHCADDKACISEDVNRLCICENDVNLNSCNNKLCKCKAGYYQNPSEELCVKDNNSFTNIDNNGLIIVCVVTGVSPLTIVLIAICCRKLMNRSSRTRNVSSVSNPTQRRRGMDSFDGNEQPPSYEEIAEPPPSYAEVIRGFGHRFQRSVSHFVRQISNIENN